jgi:uncharacterized protein
LIVVDTSILYALLDRRDARHQETVAWYEATADSLVTTPLVLAEIDHLAIRAGPAAARALYGDIAAGAFEVEWWETAAGDAVEVASQYESFPLGLVDASLVVVAARVGTTSIATFDARHFRAVRPLAGANAFTLLPADVP